MARIEIVGKVWSMGHARRLDTKRLKTELAALGHSAGLNFAQDHGRANVWIECNENAAPETVAAATKAVIDQAARIGVKLL